MSSMSILSVMTSMITLRSRFIVNTRRSHISIYLYTILRDKYEAPYGVITSFVS
jgi:hypothetical protein